MEFNEVKTIYLTLQQTGALIQKELERICRHPIPCLIKVEDLDFWEVSFQGYRMPLSEMYFVLEQIEADSRTRELSTVDDPVSDVNSISPFMSARILSKALGLCWEKDIADENGIWLIDVRTPGKENKRLFRYNSLAVDLDKLMSAEEVLAYIENHGGNYAALSELCEQNAAIYGNELRWHYPIVTDNLFSGTHILLVKEGALALPYNIIDEHDFEVFCLENAELLDEESIGMLLDDWKTFSDDLFGALGAVRRTITQLETDQFGGNV